MKIVLILSILICLIVSLHAANNLRVGTESLDETLKSKWQELKNQFDDYYKSNFKKRMALSLSLLNAKEIPNPNRIYGEKYIISHILHFAKLGNPWSVESFQSVVKSAKIMDTENPWQLVSDFTPEILNSMPLQTALKHRIDSGVHVKEALTLEFKKYTEKKKRAEAWKNMSLQERNEGFTEYVVNNNLGNLLPVEMNNCSLCDAARRNDVIMVQVLLAIGADVDEVRYGQTALVMAARLGHLEVVQKLIDAKADVNLADNNDGNTALYAASFRRHEAVVEQLIVAGAYVNAADSYGNTPLFIASRRGYENVVAQLITSGADVNLARNNGSAPIRVASWKGHAGIVENLITSGADVNLVDNYGYTALYVASENGYEGVVEKLIAARADVNQADEDGATPLYIASQNGHAGVVKLLIDAGANVNQTAAGEYTPLYVASQNGYVGIVEQLIKADGINVNKKTNLGLTALMAAVFEGETIVVRTLIAYKSKRMVVSPLFIASIAGTGLLLRYYKR